MEKKANKSKKQKSGKQDAKEEEKKESPSFGSVFTKNNQIFIVVNAKPGSKTDSIYAVEPDFIGVSVQAPPKDGQANEGIKEYVASVLNLKKRDVSLVKGDKSSDKVLMIDEPGSLTVEQVITLFKSNLQ